MPNFETFVAALLHASWQAALLALVVALVGRALVRLPASARCWLWLVVLVRLLAPSVPSSPASLFNLARLLPGPLSAAGGDMHAESPAAIEAKSEANIDPAASPSSTQSKVVSTRHAPAHAQSASALPLVLLAAIVWGLGAIVVLGRMLLAFVSLRRLIARSRPVTDAEVVSLLEECRLKAGIRRPVPLFVTDCDITPGLAGVIWPRILISQTALASLGPKNLRWLFCHELAHVRRWDLLWQRGWQLACILHWFNPLAWWAASQARLAAELGCDEFLLRQAPPAERVGYGQSLLSMAELLFAARPVSGAVSFLAREPALTTRLRAIASYEGRSLGALAGGVALVAVLVLVGLTDASAQGPPRPAGSNGEPAPPTHSQAKFKIDPKELAATKGKMQVVVLDAEGRPVERAEVFANVAHPGVGRWQITNRTYFTNKAGIAVVELPPKVGVTKLWASKKDYPKLFACWFPDLQSDASTLPAEFTFQPPLTVIGGTVKNENGKPLGGVSVEITVTSLGDTLRIGAPGQRPIFDTNSYWDSTNPGPPVAAVTNAKGRWVIDNVPLAAAIDLKLSRPGYVSEDVWNGVFRPSSVGSAETRVAPPQKIDMQTLRHQKATIVLRRSK